MERLAWPRPPAHNSSIRLELSGSYTAQMNGSECKIHFWFSPQGVLMGKFVAEGEELLLSGGISKRNGHISGFLLEPSSKTPIALFRAKPQKDGLLLEMDVPDFDELLDLCDLEHIHFSRSGYSAPKEEVSDLDLG